LPGWIAVVVVNLLTLGVLEMGARWILDARKQGVRHGSRAAMRRAEEPFDLLTGWSMRTNAVITRARTRIATDAKGRSVVPGALAQPVAVVVVTGGSTMFGQGQTNNEGTMPARLQGLLRERHGLAVNVVNLGACGYVSFQEMLALSRYLDAERADVVVSVSGHNDACIALDPVPPAPLGVGRYAGHVELARDAENGRLVVRNAGPALRRVSGLADLMGVMLERERGGDEAGAAHRAVGELPVLVRGHVANYAMMRAACEARGAEYRMYLQPTAYTKAALSDDERAVREREDAGGGAAARERRLAYVEAFRAAEKPFAFVDLSGVMGPGAETCFHDSCHFTAAGVERLAAAVADDLAPRIAGRRAR
jgi:lysophospholipase L1-like esterase